MICCSVCTLCHILTTNFLKFIFALLHFTKILDLVLTLYVENSTGKLQQTQTFAQGGWNFLTIQITNLGWSACCQYKLQVNRFLFGGIKFTFPTFWKLSNQPFPNTHLSSSMLLFISPFVQLLKFFCCRFLKAIDSLETIMMQLICPWDGYLKILFKFLHYSCLLLK